MNILKNTALYFSVLVFAFLFIYQPVQSYAQSIENLHGIQERIGDNNEVADAGDSADKYIAYVAVAAVIIGFGLYYYLKWAEKKRPSHKAEDSEKGKKVSTKNLSLTTKKENAEILLTKQE